MIQGDIVLITFPFTDLKSVKVRPALVLSKESFNKNNSDAIFVMITSNTENIRKEEVLLRNDSPEFPSTGLKKESVIRTPKIYYLSQALAKRRLGKIGPNALKIFLQQFHTLID
jgi:mRNA interferase MazF